MSRIFPVSHKFGVQTIHSSVFPSPRTVGKGECYGVLDEGPFEQFNEIFITFRMTAYPS